MRPIVGRVLAGRGQGEPRVGVLQKSRNLPSSVKCAHFVDEETEVQRQTPRIPSMAWSLGQRDLMVVCDRHVLGIGQSQGWQGAAHTQTEGAESSVTVVLSVGSAVYSLCDWILCAGAGGAKSLVLFGTA